MTAPVDEPDELVPALLDVLPYWPADDELDDYLPADPWDVARDRWRAARIAEWEQGPFDPEDSLSIIAAYPREVARLREDQARIKAEPIYQIAVRCGEDVRRRYVRDVIVTGWGDGPWVDESAAEDLYRQVVCECVTPSEFSDGSQVHRRHRDAGRCRWCVLRGHLEDRRMVEIKADAWRCSVEEAQRRTREADRMLTEAGDPPERFWWADW